MKFIIRNLGWILLIIFFAFMLYLISSQNNNKNINNNTLSGIILDNTDKIITGESVLNNISEEVKINSNKTSFIDSIKNYFNFNKSDNINKVNENVNVIKVEQADEINQNEVDKLDLDKDNLIKKEDKNIGVVDENLIKKVDKIILNNSKTNTINNKTDKKLSIINVDNKSIRKVGVKSIFLNNAYFTKRLFTAYRGDKLEQLTTTNKYGCFKVKIISSKNTINNGKIAWTCDYYMQGKTDTLNKYKNITKAYYKSIVNKKNISFNKIKEIGIKAVYLNNAYFTKRLFTVYKGDKLEQLTHTNKYGCFKVKIVSSINKINNGKIAWTCNKYLK